MNNSKFIWHYTLMHPALWDRLHTKNSHNVVNSILFYNGMRRQKKPKMSIGNFFTKKYIFFYTLLNLDEQLLRLEFGCWSREEIKVKQNIGINVRSFI